MDRHTYKIWTERLKALYQKMTTAQLQEALTAWETLSKEGIGNAERRCEIIRAEIKSRRRV